MKSARQARADYDSQKCGEIIVRVASWYGGSKEALDLMTANVDLLFNRTSPGKLRKWLIAQENAHEKRCGGKFGHPICILENELESLGDTVTKSRYDGSLGRTPIGYREKDFL